MQRHLMAGVVASFGLVASTAPALAQATGSAEASAAVFVDPTWAPPKLPWGHPDLKTLICFALFAAGSGSDRSRETNDRCVARCHSTDAARIRSSPAGREGGTERAGDPKTCTSWNQIAGLLHQLKGLRRAADPKAGAAHLISRPWNMRSIRMALPS